MQRIVFKRIVLFVFLFHLNGCKTKDFSYSELRKVKPTHCLIDQDLIKSIGDVLKDDDNYIGIDSQIIIVIITKNDDNFQVCVSRTDFEVFKKYRPDEFDDLKGYSFYEFIPVLIFGEVNDDFYKKSDAKFHDILGKPPHYDLSFPPIIYEPRMMCNE